MIAVIGCCCCITHARQHISNASDKIQALIKQVLQYVDRVLVCVQWSTILLCSLFSRAAR